MKEVVLVEKHPKGGHVVTIQEPDGDRVGAGGLKQTVYLRLSYCDWYLWPSCTKVDSGWPRLENAWDSYQVGRVLELDRTRRPVRQPHTDRATGVDEGLGPHGVVLGPRPDSGPPVGVWPDVTATEVRDERRVDPVGRRGAHALSLFRAAASRFVSSSSLAGVAGFAHARQVHRATTLEAVGRETAHAVVAEHAAVRVPRRPDGELDRWIPLQLDPKIAEARAEIVAVYRRDPHELRLKIANRKGQIADVGFDDVALVTLEFA